MTAVLSKVSIVKETALLLMLSSLAAAAAVQPTAPLRLKTFADVPLGGRATRLDYASVDEQRQLLFIAHLSDGEVIAVDTQAHRLIKRIANVAQVHGVLRFRPRIRSVRIGFISMSRRMIRRTFASWKIFRCSGSCTV